MFLPHLVLTKSLNIFVWLVLTTGDRMPREGSKKVFCPRCGAKGWIQSKRIGGREYYYCVHYEKGKRRYCYLGPKVYDYATRTHLREGLVLRGLYDEERIIDYLDSIISYLERAQLKLKPELAKQIADRLESIVKKLRNKYASQ